MKGMSTHQMLRQSEGLLAWYHQPQVRDMQQQTSLIAELPETDCGEPVPRKEAVAATVRRVFMMYERRGQTYETQGAYKRALDLYDELLTYAHEKGLGLAERDRCVGAMMRCVAASTSALLF